MPAYLPLHLVGRLLPHLMQGPIPVHRVIQLGKMHEAIAVGPGYLGIDEGDDLVGISDRLTGSIDGRAERAIAMLVRGRDLNERHIDGPGSAWHEEFGNSGQKRRRITGTPGADGLTFARTDEDRAHIKVPRPAWVRVGNRAKREGREELNVLEFLPAGDQRLDERRRGRMPPVQIHAIARLDDLHGRLCVTPCGHVAPHFLFSNTQLVEHDQLRRSRRTYMASNIAAMPCPPPMHSVTSAYLPPVRRSS